MNSTYKLIPLLFFCYFFSNAQGCSDAGICNIGNGHQSYEQKLKNEIEVSTVFGAGEADTKYVSPFITYRRNFNQTWTAACKITSSLAYGEFGKRASIGDAYLLLSYNRKLSSSFKWSFTSGAKIPFNRSNLKINNHPLPLDYQSSLGTFDFLGSSNLNYKRWDFNAAFQIPVFNINANSYFAEYAGTDDFPTTNLFHRKPDVLFRTTYSLKTKNQKFVFKPNVLFIYHIGEDSAEDIYGKRFSIDGSSGLTINGNIISAYNFKNSSIELSLATPFVVRTIRPDGLTRSFTAGISYITRF
ncbi:MAG: hypothetical protein WC622_16070 [Pedobacter sp.]|jgi:hypothetical protein|uniref:hypothetical protein n=1 Tax=Pedobacter sp. TaxID=1411316 RepID=UPI00356857AA